MLMKAAFITIMGWQRFLGSLNIQVSFTEHGSLLWGSFAKETYIFKEPTSRCHHILKETACVLQL